MSLRPSVAEFFDRDSSDYLEHKYGGGADSFMSRRREQAEQLIRTYIAPRFDGSFRFLDAGCGPGVLAETLAGYPIAYCGVDVSQEMLLLARTQAGSCVSGRIRGLFFRGDVESLPFRAQSFGATASLGVIEYLDDDDRLLAELSRVTVPGGFVLLAVTNKYAYNLMLEGLIIRLRKSRLAVRLLSYVKRKLNRGEFKPMGFVMRRHRPNEFLEKLDQHGFVVLESRFWGLNFFPYPFDVLCGRRLNALCDRLHRKIDFRPLRALGEGFIVICRKKDSGLPSMLEE